MAYIKIESIVSGEVQGVGYRFFVERMANLLGITGWISSCLRSAEISTA